MLATYKQKPLALKQNGLNKLYFQQLLPFPIGPNVIYNSIHWPQTETTQLASTGVLR